MRIFSTIAAFLLLVSPAVASVEDIDAQEQAAIAEAVAHAAPAVVQIQTVGGREEVGGVLFGSGPTSGVIVDPNGFIISSAFNFVNKPASILVRLPNGDRKPAKLAATDHARMLVLLKVETDKPLPTCEVAPRAEMRVGQWAIAVGRVFEASRPNVTVGVLSAVNRIRGKAIQTDAAVSPNNYGGVLIDIRGRALGVLAPLSPQSTGVLAGVEWYDSGIGFAVPMEDIEHVLPRLEKGEDLQPGLAGFSMKTQNLYTSPAVVSACLPESPAAGAGIKPGDEFVAIDSQPITRAVELHDALGRHYAGETIRFTVLRDKKHIKGQMRLVDTIMPFEHGFLGVLPMRAVKNGEKGIPVRYVYPNSPAKNAGIAAGDAIVSLNGVPVRDRAALADKIGAIGSGKKVTIEIQHGGELKKATIALAALPEDLPPKQLPSAGELEAKTSDNEKHSGGERLQIPEFSNEIWLYAPAGRPADEPHGVVVWLPAAKQYNWKASLAAWKSHCDRDNLILATVKPGGEEWSANDALVVRRLLAEIQRRWTIDPARILIGGRESGGSLALLSAFENREIVRAAAAVESSPLVQPLMNEPSQRLAIFLAAAANAQSQPALQRAAATLRKCKIPVTAKTLADNGSWNADEIAELARWLDTLDRI